MDQKIAVPIVLFVCVTYAFKTLVEAVTRWQMFKRGGSEELVKMLVSADEQRTRSTALYWGTVLLAIAIGLAVGSAIGWQELTMASAALLIGATALGQLVYYRLSSRKQH